MRNPIFIPALLFIFSCANHPDSQQTDTEKPNDHQARKPCLTCIYNQHDQIALINEKGDTLAPFGKFDYCFFDSTYTFGSVYDPQRNGFFAIDATGKELFQVFAFDNGPDYIEDGMFRIVKDGKIGYANEAGEIVIEPQYSCAYPFEDGKAQVTFNCTQTKEFEMTRWESSEWFYIDKSGKKID